MSDFSVVFRTRSFIRSVVGGRVKPVTSGRERQKRGMPTDVALQMAPLTDSWIIYENIAHGNGSTALPSGKYGKFGSRGPFCRRSLAIFSLHTEEGGKKRSEWKNREWVHFPRVDERELASTHSLLFTALPFRYHLLLPKASLYCALVV